MLIEMKPPNHGREPFMQKCCENVRQTFMCMALPVYSEHDIDII